MAVVSEQKDWTEPSRAPWRRPVCVCASFLSVVGSGVEGEALAQKKGVFDEGEIGRV
jgi:hypothetical protein